MKTTIYYTISDANSFEDAEAIIEHRLDTDGTEDNWYTLVACVREEDLKLKVINKGNYRDSDFTLETLVGKINEHNPPQCQIRIEDLWEAKIDEGQWDMQSITNECTSDKQRYLFIINMHS